ncbi:MAG: MarR family transcriptional regulator [Clostridiales bacterium]|nr:MarR family transcriptional regulator [Clostridiales bacterium]MCD8154615.1 MarR family transcriptional regulator [Clostridiales bacterium]
MEDSLREQFFTSMAHFRKLEATLSVECQMQMNEMAILHNIAGTCRHCSCASLDVPRMQEKLHISKPAVSYILNTLEKKNYIRRETDPRDRRKLSIRATPEGMAAAEESLRRYDQLWTELLEQFGEQNMRQLIQLLTTFNSLYDSLC